MLSYMLKNKSLRLLLKIFKHYISTVTIPKDDHQILLVLLISLTTQKGNTKIQSFPCFPSSPTLIVSADFMSSLGNGCALKGGEATAKPLVPNQEIGGIDCEEFFSRCFLLGL